MRNRRLRVRSQQVLDVGIGNEERTPINAGRQATSRQLHAKSPSRHVPQRQHRRPIALELLHLHEKLQGPIIHSSGLPNNHKAANLETNHRKWRRL